MSAHPPVSRSAAGGWSGHGLPEDGDFVRPRPAGNVHIVRTVVPLPAALYGGLAATVHMACGKWWTTYVLDPADGDHGRQCKVCWEAM